ERPGKRRGSWGDAHDARTAARGRSGSGDKPRRPPRSSAARHGTTASASRPPETEVESSGRGPDWRVVRDYTATSGVGPSDHLRSEIGTSIPIESSAIGSPRPTRIRPSRIVAQVGGIGEQAPGFILVDADPADRQRVARPRVDGEQGAVEAGVAGGDVEVGLDEGQRGGEDAVVAPADDRVVWAGHADVGLIRGAVLEDLFVGRDDVGVRAQYGRDAAVEVAAQELLVAGGPGGGVHRDDAGAGTDLAEEAIGGAERVVDRAHVGPAQDGEHGDGRAVAGGDAGELRAGGIERVVGRADHIAGPVEDLEDLVLAVDVVPHG